MMRCIFLLVLAVYGVVSDQVKVIKEGETVLLPTDILKGQHYELQWYYKDTPIALINRNPSTRCLYDFAGSMFKDKLEVDCETGSLTIKNIRPEYGGQYKYKARYYISDNSEVIIKTFFLKVIDSLLESTTEEHDKCEGGTDGVTAIEKKQGETVTLPTNITKHQNKALLWHFNCTRIAMINNNARTSCLYEGKGGIFKDKLEVDYETGTLTIKDIRLEHAGLYEAEYDENVPSKSESLSENNQEECNSTTTHRSDRNDIIKTFNLTVTGRSPGDLVIMYCVIVIVSLVIPAIACVLLCCLKKRKKVKKDMKEKEHVLFQKVKVKEDSNVRRGDHQSKSVKHLADVSIQSDIQSINETHTL